MKVERVETHLLPDAQWALGCVVLKMTEAQLASNHHSWIPQRHHDFTHGAGIGATQEGWDVRSFNRAAGIICTFTVMEPLVIIPGPQEHNRGAYMVQICTVLSLQVFHRS